MRTRNLQATAVIAMLLSTMTSQGFAQQAAAVPAPPPTGTATAPLQQVPPNYTQPLFLRPTGHDYSVPKRAYWNPIRPYTSTDYALPSLTNTPRLDQLVRDGKIYLSLSDAVMLALENNFDIAIARLNLDIADTDLLRADAGSTLRGVSTGLISGTLGGTSSTITSGGGPGGTSTATGGAGTGTSGLVQSTSGGGPGVEPLDPILTGTTQWERSKTPQNSTLSTGSNTLNTGLDEYNFGYSEGFRTGTLFTASFNNSRTGTNNARNQFNPTLTSTFQVKIQQHLLQGFGWDLNSRYIVQAKNNRQITDAAFRYQVIYTVTQVENIYWSLVSAYEDEQAKERAIAQSKKLASDNRQQLDIGTLAPLDVVNADSSVAADQQALITSQSNLEYQQLLMKQAVARDLNDPVLSNAPVVPTDRVSTERLKEEDMSVEDLVKQAYANNPQVEQAVLNIKNYELTIKAFKNGLLPTVDVYGFYGASALGGAYNTLQKCSDPVTFVPIPCVATPAVGYGDTFQNLFNSSGPDKGIGISINIPLRNRVAQADQARSQMEYRQQQMRLQQIYTQLRIQLINQQYALTNDRASLDAAIAAQKFNGQSLDAERKKYTLGASTTANVLQQSRNLATADNNLISAEAAYAKDRATLRQILASTLDAYGISLQQTAAGTISTPPVVPGVGPAKPHEAPPPIEVAPQQK